MRIDKNIIINNNIQKTLNIIYCEEQGFVSTNKNYCNLQCLNILYHTTNIIQELNEQQNTNINNLYNTLIN